MPGVERGLMSRRSCAPECRRSRTPSRSRRPSSRRRRCRRWRPASPACPSRHRARATRLARRRRRESAPCTARRPRTPGQISTLAHAAFGKRQRDSGLERVDDPDWRLHVAAASCAPCPCRRRSSREWPRLAEACLSAPASSDATLSSAISRAKADAHRPRDRRR